MLLRCRQNTQGWFEYADFVFFTYIFYSSCFPSILFVFGTSSVFVLFSSMWQIVFGIVFRLESAYILSLIEGKQPNRIISFFLVDIVISCSLSLLQHLIAVDSYHASKTTSLRNEVANVQRCVTFVTQRPLCGDKMRWMCWGQTTSHQSRLFVLLFSHSRGRMFHFDCISFCNDMPAWVIAAYSWICNDGQRFFLLFWQDFYHFACKSNPIWGI